MFRIHHMCDALTSLLYRYDQPPCDSLGDLGDLRLIMSAWNSGRSVKVFASDVCQYIEPGRRGGV